MSDGPAHTKKSRFEVPPEGVDWLWWHPDEPYDGPGQDYELERLIVCDTCQVRWVQEVDSSTKSIRCWCCGRFKRKPKVWS